MTTGKNINMSFEAGVKSLVEVRCMVKGDERLWGGVSVVGEVREVMGGKVGEIGCGFNDGGRLVLEFPALGVGRYVFVVEGSNDGGEVVRILDGYVSYGAVQSVDVGYGEANPQRVVDVMMGGEVLRVMWGRTSVAEAAKMAALAARDEVFGSVEAIKAAAEALNAGIAGALSINDAGKWVIGGVETGVTALGVAGKDGDALIYEKLGSFSDLSGVPDDKKRGYRYMVKVDEVMRVYAWSENTAEWVDITGSAQEAGVDTAGIVKLGTTLVGGEGSALVGVNAAGGLCVGVGAGLKYETGLLALKYGKGLVIEGGVLKSEVTSETLEPYAKTSAVNTGLAGKMNVSQGVKQIAVLSSAEYDALEVKDESTLYLVTE
jgi:hypothetical protein